MRCLYNSRHKGLCLDLGYSGVRDYSRWRISYLHRRPEVQITLCTFGTLKGPRQPILAQPQEHNALSKIHLYSGLWTTPKNSFPSEPFGQDRPTCIRQGVYNAPDISTSTGYEAQAHGRVFKKEWMPNRSKYICPERLTACASRVCYLRKRILSHS